MALSSPPPHAGPTSGPYGQPPQAAPAPHAPASVPDTQVAPLNIFAVLSLVSGVAALLPILGVAGSIIAIVFAFIAKNELAKNPHQRGAEYATWGLVLGIIGIVLWAVVAIIWATFSLFFSAFAPWGRGPWWDMW